MMTVDQQLFDLVEEQEHYELITGSGILISVPDDVPLCDKLETPDHFVAYAKRYYELMECSEN